MPRNLYLLAGLSAMIFENSVACAKASSAFPNATMIQIGQDYQLCQKNSGKSDNITDYLAGRMEKFNLSYSKNKLKIREKNYDLIIKWFACLVKYSNIGGDEELGYAVSLCDSFIDSDKIMARIYYLSKRNRDVKEFRRYILEYSKNIGVVCK